MTSVSPLALPLSSLLCSSSASSSTFSLRLFKSSFTAPAQNRDSAQVVYLEGIDDIDNNAESSSSSSSSCMISVIMPVDVITAYNNKLKSKSKQVSSSAIIIDMAYTAIIAGSNSNNNKCSPTVTVDAHLTHDELGYRRLIVERIVDVHSIAKDADKKDGSVRSLSFLPRLFNNLSPHPRWVGVWTFRLIAGSIFVLLIPHMRQSVQQLKHKRECLQRGQIPTPMTDDDEDDDDDDEDSENLAGMPLFLPPCIPMSSAQMHPASPISCTAAVFDTLTDITRSEYTLLDHCPPSTFLQSHRGYEHAAMEAEHIRWLTLVKEQQQQQQQQQQQRKSKSKSTGLKQTIARVKAKLNQVSLKGQSKSSSPSSSSSSSLFTPRTRILEEFVTQTTIHTCILADNSKELAVSDKKEETTIERDYWFHAARASLHLEQDELSASFTSALDSISSFFEYWRQKLGLPDDDDDEDDDNDDDSVKAKELEDDEGKEEKEEDDEEEEEDDDDDVDDVDSLLELHGGADFKQFVQSWCSAIRECRKKNEEFEKLQEEVEEEEDDDKDVEHSNDMEEDEKHDKEHRHQHHTAKRARQESDNDKKMTTNGTETHKDTALKSKTSVTSASVTSSPAAPVLPSPSFTPSASSSSSSSSSTVDLNDKAMKKKVAKLLAALLKGTAKRLPVTVFTGFLGAGKTTMVNHLLKNNDGLKIAVIVNDFSHLNIDASLIKSNVSTSLIELSNGCICCTLREDLLLSILHLCCQQVDDKPLEIDYILVESTGIGEPAPIAQTFTFDLAGNSDSNKEHSSVNAVLKYGVSHLSQVCYLDAMVTVVDASGFYHHMTTDDGRKKHQEVVNAGGSSSSSSSSSSKTIANLLMEQVEFCNILVINKVDLLSSSSERAHLRSIIHSLNPTARLHEASYNTAAGASSAGPVTSASIFNTRLFIDQASMDHPLLQHANSEWLQQQNVTGQVKSESAEYGVSSFVFFATLPFDVDRLHAMLTQYTQTSTSSSSSNASSSLFHSILRIKGVFWMSVLPSACLLLQTTTCGDVGHVQVSPTGVWLVDACQETCPTSGRELLEIDKRWTKRTKDRYNKLVIIGINLDKPAITKLLKSCLVSSSEYRSQVRESSSGKLQLTESPNQLSQKYTLFASLWDQTEGTCSIKP